MKLSKAARVAVGVIGGLVVLVGLGVWTLGSEYGSGLNFSTESDGTIHRVLEVDEQAPETEDPSVVFEGTEEEASAYIEQRRAEETNLVIPALIIAVGALIVITALIPTRKTS